MKAIPKYLRTDTKYDLHVLHMYALLFSEHNDGRVSKGDIIKASNKTASRNKKYAESRRKEK